MSKASATVSAVVTRKGHTRREDGKTVRYKIGDQIKVTEREFKLFRDRLDYDYSDESAPRRGRPPKATKEDGGQE